MRTTLLFFLILLIAACGKKKPKQTLDISRLAGSTPEARRPLRGGTFVWGRGADAVRLDPANVTDGESVKVCTNIFENLVTFAPGKTDLIPALATSWSASADKKVWTFELREGVRFHDGTPFNAEAVVFTFMRQKDANHPGHRVGDQFAYYHDNFKTLKSIEAIEDLKVRFTHSRPYAPFLSALALHCCGIVSPSAFARGGRDSEGKFRYDAAKNPVGTGPFALELWERDARIVLKANADYWQGRPYLDKLIFKPIENPHMRLKELQSGGLDGMDNPALADIESISRDKNMRLLSRPGINVCYLAMNTLKGPFRSMKVRQAIAFAIDKKRLIESAYDGMGEPAVSMCPKTLRGHNGSIVDRRPNYDKAKDLLKAGRFPDGFTCTLYHMANQRAYITNPSGTAIQIQQDLKQIGITVKLKKLDWAAYLPAVRNGEHDMCLLGWMADIADPDNFLYVLLDKENAVKGQANNVSFYQGERVHKLLLKAQRESSWPHRERFYHQVQKIVFHECPVIPLVTVPDFRVLRKNARGYTIYPAGGEYFRTVSLAK